MGSIGVSVFKLSSHFVDGVWLVPVTIGSDDKIELNNGTFEEDEDLLSLLDIGSASVINWIFEADLTYQLCLEVGGSANHCGSQRSIGENRCGI